MNICFTPNGNVTYEECPVCREPDVKVEHGQYTCIKPGEKPRDLGPAHYWHCPICGDDIAIVAGDCPHCRT